MRTPTARERRPQATQANHKDRCEKTWLALQSARTAHRAPQRPDGAGQAPCGILRDAALVPPLLQILHKPHDGATRTAQECWLHQSARSLPHEQHQDAGYNEAPLTHEAPGLALLEPRVYVELEAPVPKAIARAYMEAPGAKTEAPKQPKKQDETEAPPGWNRSRQGPDLSQSPAQFWHEMTQNQES